MIHVISGPPCSGKSTYVAEHAQSGDTIIDYDSLTECFGGQRWTHQKRDIVLAARSAAIDHVLSHPDEEAWIIDSRPSSVMMTRYSNAGAEIVTIKEERETCFSRAVADNRPQDTLEAIEAWFSKGSRTMLKKSFDLVYENETSDGGEIVAYASTFDRIPDAYGDIVAPGAFAKSLADWQASGNPIPLLFGHRTDDPRMNLGAVIEASEDERGLRIRARFDEDNEVAQYTRKLVKEGRLTKLSFAYDTLDSEIITLDDGTRATELKELKIYEISLVPIPANQLTEVLEVKDGEHKHVIRDLVAAVDLSYGETMEKICDLASKVLNEDDEDHTDEKNAAVCEKAPSKNVSEKAADPLGDALATIAALADRLDSISDMIVDMAERIAALTDTPSEDTQKNQPDIEAKSAEVEAADTDDNAEAPHEGNAEIDEKAAEILAKMARYISIPEED